MAGRVCLARLPTTNFISAKAMFTSSAANCTLTPGLASSLTLVEPARDEDRQASFRMAAFSVDEHSALVNLSAWESKA